MTEFLVTFTDNLEAVKFLDVNGEPVDPRIVLRVLAAGAMRVTFSQEIVSGEGLPDRVASQTWKIVENE